MPVSLSSIGRLLHRLGAALPALSLLTQLELCQLVWYPAYFSRYGGRSVGEIGALMSTSLVVQFVGSICGASLASCMGRGQRAYLGVCILSALLSCGLFSWLLVVDAASRSASVIAISLGFTLGLRSGPAYAVISRRAGANTGLATAFTVIANNMLALAVGPTLVGFLSNWWEGEDGLRCALQLVVSACSGLAAALWTCSFICNSDPAEPDVATTHGVHSNGRERSRGGELL